MAFSDRDAADLGVAVEGWAARVLRIHSELVETSQTKPDYWGPFDLVGVYHHRQRLELMLEKHESPVAQAVDELLKSFSEQIGTGWLDALGLADEAGAGWWWSLAPREGPLREELDERAARGT